MFGRNQAALLALFAVSTLFSAASFAQTWDETTQGLGDAGDAVGTAQFVQGSGPLTEITGDNSSATDRDIYRIRIATAATFSATTSTTPGTSTDTQIRLFQLTGLGIAFDDDSGTGFLSTMAVGNALYNALPAGDYLIAVSGFNSRSNSAGGDQFPAVFTTVGPTGPGGGQVLTGWSGTNATGTYRLTLTGCQFVSGTGPELNITRGATFVYDGGTDPLGAGFTIGTATGTGNYTLSNSGTTNVTLTLNAVSAPTGCTVALGTAPGATIVPAGTQTSSYTVTPTVAMVVCGNHQ